jgi:NADPH-dependent F420 reductase
MEVTIIGAGNMGRGIGTRLVAGANTVTIIDHDPDQAAQLAEELDGVGDGHAVAAAADQPLQDEVVILAVWYPASLDAVEEFADRLDGKIVVDISNPVDTETFDGLVTPANSSAAEEVEKKAPSGARVVKAFNTTFAGTLVAGQVGGESLNVFIAGDDESAKDTVSELARSGGLTPVDAGPLKRARQLEQLGFLHMSLQESLGTSYGSGVKVVTP